MANIDTRVEVFDFSGGRNSYNPEFLIAENQSPDCQNINLLERGFEKRRGNTAFNSSAMVDATTAIVGMNYFKPTSGTEYLTAVAGTKIFKSDTLDGTMDDVTGALSVTAGQNNFWTILPYNDLQIGFGGAPNAPWKYSGTGNAAALGGSPPSAKHFFVAANRLFAMSTAANPSRIQWPILGNPEDWTGTGSGSSDVSKNDGEELLTGVPLGHDMAILFKNTSTHLMVLTASPFPIYQLQKGIGAAGRYSVVSANGTIYFITPSLQMFSTTDGRNFQEYPNAVDDLWKSINPTRIPFISGIYYPILDQIHWYISTGASTTNNIVIVWDLKRKAWLYHPTGFKANVATLVQNRRLFTGHYNGKMYEQDKALTFTDASETTPFAIDAYWTTPWYRAKSLGDIVHPRWAEFSCLSETTGSIDVSYGFDFAGYSHTEAFSLISSAALWNQALWDVASWGGATSLIKRLYMMGRGNVCSLKFRNATPSQGYTFQGFTLQLRPVLKQKTLAIT